MPARRHDQIHASVHVECRCGVHQGVEAGIVAVHRVGDCVAPRLIADAIFDGHHLAREIDRPDPAVAAPYLRERPLVPR